MINDPQFELFFGTLLIDEGGYSDDPHDPGNWTSGRFGRGELKGTKYGISAATYPDLDIKNLTEDQAADIYAQDWWLKYGFNRLPSPIGAKLCDLAVNCGSRPEITLLQQALCMLGYRVDVDGSIGDQTAAAAKRCNPDALHAQICKLAAEHYEEIVARHPEDARYLAGWLKRAAE